MPIIFWQMAISDSGMSDRLEAMGAGSFCWCASSRMAIVPSGNGGWPVSVKYSVQPRL